MHFKIALFFIFFVLMACGKKKDDKKTDVYSCHTPSNNLSGCCSSHGGGKTCENLGDYVFTATRKLVCADNTVSPTCTGVY
jgi:hypothetical protein